MQTQLLIDSSVWVDYLLGRDYWHTRYLSDALTTFEVCVCDLIITEVLQGIRNDSHFKLTRDLLLGFTPIAAAGPQFAVRVAENYRTLRKRGITLRTTIDCVIATAAIEADIPLLANDRDFYPLVKHLGLNLIIQPR